MCKACAAYHRITGPSKPTKLRAITNPSGREASLYTVLGVKFSFRAASIFTVQFMQ